MRHPGSVLRHTLPVRSAMRAGSPYKPAAVPVKTSCESEPYSALPMQPGERSSFPDRCPQMRCSYDDPPDVNCRAKSYSAADHLINPHYAQNPLLGLAGVKECKRLWVLKNSLLVPNSRKWGDRKCLPKPRKSFVGLPNAKFFWPFSGE